MFKHVTRFLAFRSILAGTSCAGSYKAIQPDRIATYQSTATSPASPVEFSYQYSALITHGGNKKYLKKERKRGYQVVAVKVKNNTTTDLQFGRDLELSFGNRPIMPVPAVQAASDLKQGVAIYLLTIPPTQFPSRRNHNHQRLRSNHHYRWHVSAYRTIYCGWQHGRRWDGECKPA